MLAATLTLLTAALIDTHAVCPLALTHGVATASLTVALTLAALAMDADSHAATATDTAASVQLSLPAEQPPALFAIPWTVVTDTHASKLDVTEAAARTHALPLLHALPAIAPAATPVRTISALTIPYLPCLSVQPPHMPVHLLLKNVPCPWAERLVTLLALALPISADLCEYLHRHHHD